MFVEIGLDGGSMKKEWQLCGGVLVVEWHGCKWSMMAVAAGELYDGGSVGFCWR